jgi:hypothetical protein
MSITAASMLVELSTSVWTATKTDREATVTVTADNNAVSNAAKVQKNLMAGSSLRKEISEAASQCRAWHAARTLPWMDRGARLLPTSLFFEYKTEMNKRKAEFEALVAKFLDEYPVLVQQAQVSLGTLFDPGDYPSVQEVATKFGMTLTFSPVPDSGDFRLDIPAEDLAEVRASYEQSFNDRVTEAMAVPVEQLRALLLTTVSKLTDDEGEGETKKRYHETLITNATNMCEMIPHMNLTNDPKLENLRLRLLDVMSSVTIEDIRESAYVRADTKQRLEAIMTKMGE